MCLLKSSESCRVAVGSRSSSGRALKIIGPATANARRLSTYSRRAFAVAGQMTFNALPDELRDRTVNTTTFRRLLKTHFFSRAIYEKQLTPNAVVGHRRALKDYRRPRFSASRPRRARSTVTVEGVSQRRAPRRRTSVPDSGIGET